MFCILISKCRVRRVVVAGGLMWGIIGCGNSEPVKGSVKKASVSGVVTMGGEPLEGAEIYFFTDRFTGIGTTDAEGKFRLIQGAAVGPNKVFISKLEGWNAVKLPHERDPVMALNDPGQVDAAMRASNWGKTGDDQPKQLIPRQFSSLETTPLKIDVPKGGVKDADFEL